MQLTEWLYTKKEEIVIFADHFLKARIISKLLTAKWLPKIQQEHSDEKTYHMHVISRDSVCLVAEVATQQSDRRYQTVQCRGSLNGMSVHQETTGRPPRIPAKQIVVSQRQRPNWL